MRIAAGRTGADAEKMGGGNAFPGAPPIGAVVEGHVYKGGDPNDPASWEAQ